MRKPAAAGALLALAAAPAAAVPPGNPADTYAPGTQFQDPPIWVSAHGVEKWIFNPSQCFVSPPLGTVCGDGPPTRPGDRFVGTTFRLRRGELVSFHISHPVAEFGIRSPIARPGKRPMMREQLLRPDMTVRWRVTGKSRIVQIRVRHMQPLRDSWYAARLLIK
jgi:hypothetical protein